MNTTAATLELIASARQKVMPAEDLAKAFTEPGSSTVGLQGYDLSPVVARLFPMDTPIRNDIPRVGGGFGSQANWKAITGINVNGIRGGVSERNRGPIIATTMQDYNANFKGLGLEDYVTYEAGYSAQGFIDLQNIAVEGLLNSCFLDEERTILGGNNSYALGVTPTPTVAAVAGGGTLTAGTLSVICVALGFDAWWSVGGWNEGVTGQSLSLATAVIPGLVTRTNADNSTDSYGGGSAQKSTAAAVTVAANGSATASVAAVRGAAGYAWFWGAAGSETLGAIGNINSVSITAAAGGTQLASSLPASDNSRNALVFDGLLTQVANPTFGSNWTALATGTVGVGSKLTADGAGGIVEIDSMFWTFWNLYRLSPDVIYMNARQLLDCNAKIISGGGAPLYRFNIDGNNPGVINAGTVIGSYLNKITSRQVKIRVHPNIPQGTMLFYTKQLPYKLAGISSLLQIKTRQEWMQIEWPRTKRSWDYGVYADEVLQNFFPPAFGVLTNIAAG